MSRFAVLLLLMLALAVGATVAGAQELQLKLLVQSQNIVQPNPVRATLQLRNTGQKTIWLYRPVGDISQISQGSPVNAEENATGPGETSGGSRLEIHLARANAPALTQAETPARGTVILTPGFPHPRLIALKGGGTSVQNVLIRVDPARTKTAQGEQPIWGPYRFSVAYSARYSNQDELGRDLEADLWHAELRSDEISLNLQPAQAQGSIEGVVLDSYQRPSAGVLVTLSDENEEPLSQTYTDGQGQFSFGNLPGGRYWLTARRPASNEDTSTFRHIDLSGASPHATIQLMMLSPETYKPEQLLHKPVIFRIVDSSGSALAGVKLAIVWSTGNVMEDFKHETDADGYAVLNLLPGQNFVTLRRAGCQPEDRRADVASGGGVDGFKFVYDCSSK